MRLLSLLIWWQLFRLLCHPGLSLVLYWLAPMTLLFLLLLWLLMLLLWWWLLLLLVMCLILIVTEIQLSIIIYCYFPRRPFGLLRYVVQIFQLLVGQNGLRGCREPWRSLFVRILAASYARCGCGDSISARECRRSRRNRHHLRLSHWGCLL